MDTEDLDLRDTIASAMEGATEKEEAPAPAEVAPEPVAPEPEAAQAAETESAKGRDEKGRFAKSATQKTSTKPPAAKRPGEVATTGAAPGAQAVAPPTTPAAPELKAPQSLKPAAREHWAKLPPEVQQDWVRREKEMATTLQQSAEARKGWQEFQSVVAPHLPLFQADGAHPLEAVKNVLQTAAALRLGSIPTKAGLIASMISQFGVPLEHINAALQGQPAPQAQGPAHFDPQQLARQVEQNILGRLQQERATSTQTRAEAEVASYAEKLEFMEDVREDMADILEMAARRGVAMSVEDAYNKAIRGNDELFGILQQREQAKAAENAKASTQQSRAAALSIKSRPAGVSTAPQPEDLRSIIAATVYGGE